MPRSVRGWGREALADLRASLSNPRVSRPGQAPGLDTGELRDGYRLTATAGQRGGRAQVDLETDVEYAPYLEYGTSRMEARPHVRPMLARQELRLTETIARNAAAAARRAARRVGA